MFYPEEGGLVSTPLPVPATAGKKIALRAIQRFSTKTTVRPRYSDGIAVGTPGELTIPLVLRYVDDMVVVEEDEVTQATLPVATRLPLASSRMKKCRKERCCGSMLPSFPCW